jgi:uncharacterized repeat protein (TIGR04138 family)
MFRPMSLSQLLSEVLARDPRYPIEAYAFLFESLDYTRNMLKRKRSRFRATRVPPHPFAQHVTGQELSEGARRLALEQYGQLAPLILGQWGIRSTSDLGSIVYNLIESGAMAKTPTDSRTDFDNVYDFSTGFQAEFVLDPDTVS